MLRRLVFVAVVVLCIPTGGVPLSSDSSTSRVDFAYAFGTPHRLTVARPDSGDKTLLDLEPGSLRIAWTYEGLTRIPFAIFKTPRTEWGVRATPMVDGKAFSRSHWTRMDGELPVLVNTYEADGATVRLTVTGAKTAAVVRIEIANTGRRARQVTLQCASEAWGENPAWVSPGEASADALVAGWNERADRVMILGVGADGYTAQTVNRAVGETLLWDVPPGATRTGWLVRPYRAYAADLPTLRKHDWAAEEAAAIAEWRRLLGRAAQVTIPDPGVEHAFRACLADLFIMREPVEGGGIGAIPGTEGYRAANAVEGGIVPIALDQLGLHREAERGYRRCIAMQEPDGNWNDAKAWGHLMWCIAGFKAWTAMEHYRLTGDRAYLAGVYPRMRANSRWQETHRAKSQRLEGGEKPLTYGLMPRGMGDCGLMNDDDLYGVFLPHNIWAVYADKLTVEAAEILGRSDDLPDLRRIYETGRDDLLAALDRGSIQADGYRWIPGVPGKTSGSRWGALNALFPCGLLPADHPLITGTIRYMESRLSPGGIPVHTGWMPDGMWVAITLDNLAEAHLVRGDGDAAARYLYATLNHGTPLLTWCEERGQAPGTSECSGDRQHLWTPVAVVRAVRDCLVMEDGDGLHMLRGADREWLGSGQPVGMRGAATHAGPVTFSVRYDAAKSRVEGAIAFSADRGPAWAVVHLRLPGGRRVTSSSAEVLPGGEGVRLVAPRGRVNFWAVVD